MFHLKHIPVPFPNLLCHLKIYCVYNVKGKFLYRALALISFATVARGPETELRREHCNVFYCNWQEFWLTILEVQQ